MTTPSVIFFCIAAIFYVLAWAYIRQLVRDVNSRLANTYLYGERSPFR